MKNNQYDVVVVAGGLAGLSAAIAAAERKAKVLVLEKSDRLGGSANFETGIFAVQTPLQKKNMVGITVEEAFGRFMEYVHYRVDPRLVRDYLVKSPDTIRWLEEKGVQFAMPVKSFRSAEATCLIPRPGDLQVVQALEASARELGVEVLFQTTAQELVKEDGKIVGVKAVCEGEPIEIAAKAVILATGGFGSNPKMIREITGLICGENVLTTSQETNTGDGIRMAEAVGCGKSRMILELDVGVNLSGSYPAARTMFRQPALMVNLFGERIMDEEITENGTYAANQILIQPKGCAFMIMDEAIARDYMENGPEIYHFQSGSENCSLDGFFQEMEQAAQAGEENLICADSVEELAMKAGICAERLQQTVDEYNLYCESGQDGYFGKSHYSLKAVKGPKYYAAKLIPASRGSLGGIKIDHKAQVLDTEYDVIPGLYAAGRDACDIFDDSFLSFFPGSTMGFAVNSGRIAGENAADFAIV